MPNDKKSPLQSRVDKVEEKGTKVRDKDQKRRSFSEIADMLFGKKKEEGK